MTPDPKLNARIAAVMARHRQADAIAALDRAKRKGNSAHAINVAQARANRASLEAIRAEVAAGDAG